MPKWTPKRRTAARTSPAEPFPSAPPGEDFSEKSQGPEVPAEDEKEAGLGRSLSRVFAGLSQDELRPVVERILKQASEGDTQAQALFLRLEALLASKPVVDQDQASIRPVHVEAAENALNALARKMQARMSDETCPWCGGGGDDFPV